jgi:hypothetical protein
MRLQGHGLAMCGGALVLMKAAHWGLPSLMRGGGSNGASGVWESDARRVDHACLLPASRPYLMAYRISRRLMLW